MPCFVYPLIVLGALLLLFATVAILAANRSQARSIFRYRMHTLPDEVNGPIGTSTLFAAWNAAIYVAQIEDVRLSEVVRDGRYLEATDRVLKKHGGLWFNDETYVISRRRA